MLLPLRREFRLPRTAAIQPRLNIRLAKRQLGAALWLVDRLAIRVGAVTTVDAAKVAAAAARTVRTAGVKGDKKAKGTPETRVYGASTLLARHVRSVEGGGVRLEFLGKDGVPYLRTITQPFEKRSIKRSPMHGDETAAAIRELAALARKAPSGSSPLFPEVSSATVNAAISALLPEGATSRTLRTCAACELFDRSLDEVVGGAKGAPKDVKESAKVRKGAAKGAKGAKGGAKGAVKGAAKGVAKGPTVSPLAAVALLVARARVAALLNHRRGSSSSGSIDETEAALDAVVRSLEASGATSVAIKAAADATNAIVRDAGLSLTTARANYLDPRISVAFHTRLGLPPDRGFTSALAARYAWAMKDVAEGTKPFSWSNLFSPHEAVRGVP